VEEDGSGKAVTDAFEHLSSYRKEMVQVGERALEFMSEGNGPLYGREKP